MYNSTLHTNSLPQQITLNPKTITAKYDLFRIFTQKYNTIREYHTINQKFISAKIKSHKLINNSIIFTRLNCSSFNLPLFGSGKQTLDSPLAVSIGENIL